MFGKSSKYFSNDSSRLQKELSDLVAENERLHQSLESAKCVNKILSSQLITIHDKQEQYAQEQVADSLRTARLEYEEKKLILEEKIAQMNFDTKEENMMDRCKGEYIREIEQKQSQIDALVSKVQAMEIKVREADEAKSLYLCCSKELFRCPDCGNSNDDAFRDAQMFHHHEWMVQNQEVDESDSNDSDYYV